MQSEHKQQGVTLLELMVVVAVISILAAIAYPSYRNQIMRSHRSEAKAALMELQVAQEKYFLQNNAYVTDNTTMATATTASGLGIPTSTTNGYYTISVGTNGAAPSYLATAIVTTNQDDDAMCQAFTINETGAREAYNSQTSFLVSNKTTASCW